MEKKKQRREKKKGSGQKSDTRKTGVVLILLQDRDILEKRVGHLALSLLNANHLQCPAPICSHLRVYKLERDHPSVAV